MRYRSTRPSSSDRIADAPTGRAGITIMQPPLVVATTPTTCVNNVSASIDAAREFRLTRSRESQPSDERLSLGGMRNGVSWRSPPAFRKGIHHVVALCAEKKMVRVDAWRVVAPMADTQSGGDIATRERPRHPMSQSRPALKHEHSVALQAAAPRPFQTTSIRVEFCTRSQVVPGFNHSRHGIILQDDRRAA